MIRYKSSITTELVHPVLKLPGVDASYSLIGGFEISKK